MTNCTVLQLIEETTTGLQLKSKQDAFYNRNTFSVVIALKEYHMLHTIQYRYRSTADCLVQKIQGQLGIGVFLHVTMHGSRNLGQTSHYTMADLENRLKKFKENHFVIIFFVYTGNTVMLNEYERIT